MNKYLEKIATIPTFSDDTKNSVAKNKKMSTDTKRDLAHTATIGAVGFGTGMLGAAIAKKVPKIGNKVWAAGALTGALGLAGDYGAVKFNKKLNDKIK